MLLSVNSQINKIKLKELKGSSFFISMDEKDILGKGSFGKVVRVYDSKNPKEDLVVKIIDFNAGGSSKFDSIKTEIMVLKKIPYHTNLVNYKKIKLSSHNKHYFIMEYCNGGTLAEQLNKCKYQMSEIEIVDFLQQFCKGNSEFLLFGSPHCACTHVSAHPSAHARPPPQARARSLPGRLRFGQ